MATLFVLVNVVMLVGIAWTDSALLLPLVSGSGLTTQTTQRAMQIALVGFLVGAPLSTAWLRRVVAVDRLPTRRREPSRADADGTPAAVANALLTVSEVVSRLTRLDEILETVVEIAPRSVEVDYCGIALWAEDTGTYTGAVASGGTTIDERFAGLQLAPEDVPDFEWVRRLGHCAVVPAPDNLHGAPLDMRAVLIAPLVSGDRFYGVMEFARRNARRAFTQFDMAIADGIARQTAVALERARLVEHGRRLVRAVESTEEAVLITDASRRVTFANRAAVRMLGFQREEILGCDAAEFARDEAAWIADLEQTPERRSWRGEAVVRRRDGTTVPVLLNASLIRDDDGRLQGAVANLTNISAEKSLQEHMQRADRLAAVGQMAAGITHEINNALVVIFGQTGSRATQTESELRRALAQVEAQGRRIADIVQGVLGLARPRPLQTEPIDLAVIARKTLDLVQHDLVSQAVRVETALDTNVPQVDADPQQVQQVLLNLFGNALQAMAGCDRRCLRGEMLAVDDGLALRVSDSGSGIASEVVSRVFDPFFSTKSEGSGLGLSVSYAIARAHGGDLQVTSEVGRGTTFTLLLPLAAASVSGVVERVLVVDDDPDVAEALMAMLITEGVKVSCAATGEEALATLRADSWDAVFLDVRLPDRSGPEVYTELVRTRPELAQRVVFVTGGLWRRESRLREELPAQPTLAKPCTQDQVHEVLQRLRSSRRQAA